MKLISCVSLLTAGLFVAAVPAVAKVGDLLPKPHVVAMASGGNFSLGRAVQISDATGCKYLRTVFERNGCTIDAEAAAKVVVRIVEEIPGAFNHQVPEYPDEAYSIEVSENLVEIEALTEVGVVRAAQTLQQMAEGWDGETAQLESVKITDWPAFKLRGFGHDIGRSFLDFDYLKRHIDLLARFKVNTFHWHLTEYTGWRIEVKAYPKLTQAEYQGRYGGKFYTQAEASELVGYAKERGVTVIPEIDMPGHSEVFKKAMGHDMQTDEGVEELKVILNELCKVFKDCPYIHIGGDEVTITYPNFLKTMADHVRNQGYGQKVMMWNRLVAGPPTAEICDMTQMWASSGKVVNGLPNVDCRYNYTNHFDVYADLVGIYKSNIYYSKQGTDDVAGTISFAWNDTKVPTEEAIIKMNNYYANVLASGERAWKGGGEQYIEQGGTTLPNAGSEFEEFADFERRFLFHKAHSLKGEPIPYVKQTNVHWRITDPVSNGGNNSFAFGPELSTDDVLPASYEVNGQTVGTQYATGAGVWLKHIWHGAVPSFFKSPGDNQTAYAWTYIYSPEEQDAKAQIEFYNYSRSGTERMPQAGQWDRHNSKIWLNDVEIPAPTWEQPDATVHQNHETEELKNENFTNRPLNEIHLKKGWNKVLMRLPHMSITGAGRPNKWQFTFVVTDQAGENALDGLIYSPTKSMNPTADQLNFLVSEVSSYIAQNFSDELGYYPASLADDLKQKLAEVNESLAQDLTEEECQQLKLELMEAYTALKEQAETAGINMPKASTDAEKHAYQLYTPLRGTKYPTAQSAGSDLIGTVSPTANSLWQLKERTDGSFDLYNEATKLYISPASAHNTALKTVTAKPDAGWTFSPADEPGYFIITSGSVQFNQTNQQAVYNWGDGTNTTDTGCKYKIAEKELPAAPTEPKLSTTEMVYWYNFNTPLREGRYPTSTGVGNPVHGDATPTELSAWKFQERGDGTFDIVNREDGGYVSPDVANNTALVTSATAPATGWQYKPAATSGYFVLINGTKAQFNQTNNNNEGFNYNVFNWGCENGVYNTSDTGCQYAFYLVESEVTGISDVTLDGKDSKAYYDLQGRRVASPAHGVYIRAGKKVVVK